MKVTKTVAMPTLKELERRIRLIAVRSKKFKIGETSQELKKRLQGADYKGYSKIKLITRSTSKKEIDRCESKMIPRFINLPNCKNLNEGSANEMPDDAPIYRLYVVYNPLPKTKS